MKDDLVSAGDDSIITIGDNNQIISAESITTLVQQKDKFIKRSLLLTVSRRIIEAGVDDDVEYDISKNTEWGAKLEFNNFSDQYKRILTSEAEHYPLIEEIMNDLEDSESLVKTVKRAYLPLEKAADKSNHDADWILDGLLAKLNASLHEVEKSASEEASLKDEDREKCIWLILFYVFTRCQIFKAPATN